MAKNSCLSRFFYCACCFRIEAYEERLREAQIDKEAAEKKSLDSVKQTKVSRQSKSGIVW